MTGLGSLDSSLSASVEYAHMTGAYEPAELEKHLNTLRSVAQLTNQTMHGEESIAKYSVPIGMAAGMDPDRALIETGFLQQQGFNSSTAGTGLSAVILGALNTGGGISAHLEHSRHQMEREFRDALHLTPEQSRQAHGGGGSAHVRALADLGITRGGQLTTVDDHGNFDIGKLQEDIRNYARSHSHQEVLRVLHDAFGTRGERIAAIYAEQDSGTRLNRFGQAVQTSPTAREIQTDLAQSPMQQFEQMLANVANVGNTLAQGTLPGLNTAFQTLNTSLSALNDWLRAHPAAAEAAGYGSLGVAGLGALGLLGFASRPFVSGARMLGRGARGLWNIGRGVAGEAAGAAEGIGGAAETFASGAEGLASGAAGGIGGAITAGIARALPILMPLGLGGDTARNPEAERALRAQTAQEEAEYLRTHPRYHPPIGATPATPSPAAAAAAAAGREDERHQRVQTVNAPITVHLGPITMNGVADSHTFNDLLSRLTDSLKSALSHATGPGQGSDSSHFVFGGT